MQRLTYFRNRSRNLHILFCLLFSLAPIARASPLSVDILYLDGSQMELHQKIGNWLLLPSQDIANRVKMVGECNEPAGQRGSYIISNDKLMLTGFLNCGVKVELNIAYGSNTAVEAKWISGDFFALGGKLLCSTPGVFQVLTDSVTFRVNEGIVTEFVKTDNHSHPAVPTGVVESTGVPLCKTF